MTERPARAGRRPGGAGARPGAGGEPPPGRGTRPRGRVAGFTLLELLIVTVMLGILAAIAFPFYQGIRERAARAALESELRTLRDAQELHFVEHDTYTDDLDRLEYDPGSDVEVELRAASSGSDGPGWAGRLTDRDFGVRCAYYQGSASPFAPASEARTIACDDGG